MTLLDEHFVIPGNLKTVLGESVNVWFSEKRDKKVLLRVGSGAAYYFKKKEYVPLQKIRKENKDGSLLVETTICHDMEAIPAVLQWIPHVRVIKPAGLAKEIKESVKEYLKSL